VCLCVWRDRHFPSVRSRRRTCGYALPSSGSRQEGVMFRGSSPRVSCTLYDALLEGVVTALSPALSLGTTRTTGGEKRSTSLQGTFADPMLSRPHRAILPPSCKTRVAAISRAFGRGGILCTWIESSDLPSCDSTYLTVRLSSISTRAGCSCSMQPRRCTRTSSQVGCFTCL